MDKARQLAPNHFPIEVYYARALKRMKGAVAARAFIDNLAKAPEAATSYDFAALETAYWSDKPKSPEYARWIQEELKRAQTNAQKIHAQQGYGDDLMMSGDPEGAIKAFKKIEHLIQNDPWFAHNLSVCYMRAGDLENAQKYNELALSIAQFGAAQQVTKLIADRQSKLQKKTRSRIIFIASSLALFACVAGAYFEIANQQLVFLAGLVVFGILSASQIPDLFQK